jgi:hypothetical protein
MLLGTDGGQAFAEAQVEAMMSADGLRGIERRMFDSPDDSGALIDISDGGAGWPSGYRPPV